MGFLDFLKKKNKEEIQPANSKPLSVGTRKPPKKKDDALKTPAIPNSGVVDAVAPISPAAPQSKVVQLPVQESVPAPPIAPPPISEVPAAAPIAPAPAPVSEIPVVPSAVAPVEEVSTPDLSDEIVSVPAGYIVSNLPENTLKKGQNASTLDALTLNFSKDEILPYLATGSFQMTVSECVLKLSEEYFVSDAPQNETVFEVSLEQIIPLIPPAWFLMQGQDLSKSDIVSGMDNPFKDLEGDDNSSSEYRPDASEPAEPISEAPVAEAIEESSPEIAESAPPSPVTPPIVEEAVPAAVTIEEENIGEHIALAADKVLPHIPVEFLKTPWEETVGNCNNFEFKFLKEKVLIAVKEGKFGLTVGECLEKFPDEHLNDGAKMSEVGMEISLQDIMALIPPAWFAINNQDTSKSELVDTMDNPFQDAFDNTQTVEIPPIIEKATEEDVAEKIESTKELEAAETAPGIDEIDLTATIMEDMSKLKNIDSIKEEEPVKATELTLPVIETESSQEKKQEKTIKENETPAPVVVPETAKIVDAPKPVVVAETAKVVDAPKPVVVAETAKVVDASPAEEEFEIEFEDDTEEAMKAKEAAIQSIETSQKAGRPSLGEVKEVGQEHKTELSKAPNGIDVNWCTAKDLCRLHSAGLKLANAIIEYRETNGKFKSLNELRNVPGVGANVYKNLTGLTAKADLISAERRLNEVVGLDIKDDCQLNKIIDSARENFALKSLVLSGSDGFTIASSGDTQVLDSNTELLAAVAPQLFKRTKHFVKQAKLTQPNMFTFYIQGTPITFALADQVFIVFTHNTHWPSTKQLAQCTRLTNELSWFCSYRAVI